MVTIHKGGFGRLFLYEEDSLIPDHERSLSFVQGLMDAAESPTPHAIILYPETMIHIRRIVERVQELERREVKRAEQKRQAGAIGGKIGGRIGGSSTSEKKRAASRANLEVARLKKTGQESE